MSIDPLNIGASGLDAYGTQIDVSANNIANVETAGFQSQDVSFQSVLSGVSVGAITTNPTPGTPGGSNVNIGDEFVKMMIAQSAFDANAQTVHTANQNLTTLLNMESDATNS
jgi:flagellar hook protein FlgE